MTANLSNKKQLSLGLLGEISNEIKNLPWEHVALCDTEQAAMRLCISSSPVYRSQQDLAVLLDYKTVGALNTILNSDRSERVRYMGRARQSQLQRLCRNRAIDQWQELYERGGLNCQRSDDDEENLLLKQLAEVRARKQQRGL